MTTVDFWAWYPVEIGNIFFIGVGASIVLALTVVSFRVWRVVTIWIDRRMRLSTEQMAAAAQAELGTSDAEITCNRRVGHCFIRLSFIGCCVWAKRAAEWVRGSVLEPCFAGCCPSESKQGQNWSSPFDEQQQVRACSALCMLSNEYCIIIVEYSVIPYNEKTLNALQHSLPPFASYSHSRLVHPTSAARRELAGER